MDDYLTDEWPINYDVGNNNDEEEDEEVYGNY